MRLERRVLAAARSSGARPSARSLVFRAGSALASGPSASWRSGSVAVQYESANAPLASSKCRPWRMPPSSSPWPTRTRSTRSRRPARRAHLVGPGAAVDVVDRCVPLAFQVQEVLELAGALVHEAFDRDGLDLPRPGEVEVPATRSP